MTLCWVLDLKGNYLMRIQHCTCSNSRAGMTYVVITPLEHRYYIIGIRTNAITDDFDSEVKLGKSTRSYSGVWIVLGPSQY